MERDDDARAVSCSNTEPILEVGQVRTSKIKLRRKEAKCGSESIDGEDVITPKDNLLVRICRRGGQGKAINHALAGLTSGRGANQISKDMGKYVLIWIVCGTIAGLQYLNARLHEDEPVKFWIAMVIAVIAAIVAGVAFVKWVEIAL